VDGKKCTGGYTWRMAHLTKGKRRASRGCYGDELYIFLCVGCYAAETLTDWNVGL